MADNGNAIAYGTEMCGGFYSPMEAHNVVLENGDNLQTVITEDWDLIADDVVNTSTQVDLTKYTTLIILLWLGGKGAGATFTSCAAPVLIGCKARPIFGDTYITVTLSATSLSYSASTGSYTGTTVSVYGKKKHG